MKKSGVGLSLLILVSLVCFSSGARAEGFFEMLFGGGQHRGAAPQVTAQFAQPRRQTVAHKRHFSVAAHHRRTAHSATRVAHRTHFKSRFLASKPLKGKEAAANWGAPTKLNYSNPPAMAGDAQAAIARVLHDDATLRPGDAYMTDDGLRVYVGEQQSDLRFVPVKEARQIGKHLKARLSEMERTPFKTMRVAALKNGDKAGVHAAPETKPIKSSKERLIKASNGKMIRLVGGYAQLASVARPCSNAAAASCKRNGRTP